jgi:hypothetical protein
MAGGPRQARNLNGILQEHVLPHRQRRDHDVNSDPCDLWMVMA